MSGLSNLHVASRLTLNPFEAATEARPRNTQGAEFEGQIRLLYMAGWGRSGSTLLARMLAQVPGVIFVGETRDIWHRGQLEDRLCGCGQRFSECPFWVEVGEIAFGGWGAVDPHEMLKLRAIADRPWSLPLLWWEHRRGPGDGPVSRYVDVLDRLFAAVQTVSGAAVVVDSSKAPSFALLLDRVPDVSLRVVHLVRDSRGTVYSWEKHVERHDSPGKSAQMMRYSTLAAALRYLGYNMQAHMLRRLLTAPYLFLRYEDLIAEPKRYLGAILRHADIEVKQDGFSFIDGRSVVLGANHTVSGNPIRLKNGSIELMIDNEWRNGMSRPRRLIVSAVTAPLLRRYHYPVLGHRD